MRIPIFLTVLGASTLALAAHAQETQPAPPADQPVTSQPAPGDPAPVDSGTTTSPSVAPAPTDNAAPAPAAPPPAAYNAAPTGAPPAAGPTMIVQGPPVVQNVPAPPADYPVCSKTVKDACRNPGGR